MSSDELVQRILEQQLVRSRTGDAPKPTVASVAASAGLSRSSLYRFHPMVVAQIRELKGDRAAKTLRQLQMKVAALSSRLKAEKELTGALARACATLATQKAEITEQFEDEKLSWRLRIDHLENQLRGRSNVRPLRPR